MAQQGRDLRGFLQLLERRGRDELEEQRPSALKHD
jgi:hypothetical protein